MEQHRIGGLPSQLIDRYLMTVEAMIDGAREEGRLGYLRAARQPHRQTWWFRFIGILYSYLGLSRPLAAYLARRLQTLLIRSEEHTSELQPLMRISYAVFCLKKTTPH